MTSTTRLQRIEKLLLRRAPSSGVRLERDPVAFATRVGFSPDTWQEAVLRSTSRRLILNCCRQSGKSTITALLALWEALTVPRLLTLMVSPSQRQSSELFRKVTDFMHVMPDPPGLVEDNKLSLQMYNGSRIVSLPASEPTIRGFSGASLIIEDESARVDDAIFYALRPMLAVSGGRHILMSTPWGRRGHFFTTWESGETWQRVEVPAADCPRIPRAFLIEEQRSMPSFWFDSEYNCQFTDVDGAVFRYDDLVAALSSDVTPLVPSVGALLFGGVSS